MVKNPSALRTHKSDPWVGKIWRRKWLPTPVFLPGKFHGQRSLPIVHGVTKDSDMTWQLNNSNDRAYHVCDTVGILYTINLILKTMW